MGRVFPNYSGCVIILTLRELASTQWRNSSIMKSPTHSLNGTAREPVDRVARSSSLAPYILNCGRRRPTTPSATLTGPLPRPLRDVTSQGVCTLSPPSQGTCVRWRQGTHSSPPATSHRNLTLPKGL